MNRNYKQNAKMGRAPGGRDGAGGGGFDVALTVAVVTLIAFVMFIIALTPSALVPIAVTDTDTDTDTVEAIAGTADSGSGDKTAGATATTTTGLVISATPPDSDAVQDPSLGEGTRRDQASLTRPQIDVAAADGGHNGFHDKINTSNQGDGNGLTRSASTPGPSPATTSTGKSQPTLEGEGIALQESLEPLESPSPSPSPLYDQQLLRHRNKRYLLFPESSSFQLIFDLIIGIVDYTSFAILGITCAVAWELPSKPPSEILEDVQTRLAEGTLGLSRRNDSASGSGSNQQGLQYVLDAKAGAAAGVDANANGLMSATVGAGTRPYYNYNDNYNNFGPPPYHYPGGDAARLNPHSNYDAYYNHNNNYYKQQQRNNNGVVTGPSGHSTSGDQKKFVDWNPSGSSYTNNNRYHQQQRWSPPSKYAGENYLVKDTVNNNYNYNYNNNWWQRNAARVSSGWRQRQQQWAKYDQRPGDGVARPAPVYAGQRSGRARQLLREPPRHRIYPVFGRRRRRGVDQDKGQSLDEFEAKMERVHRREHLRSRQKLFGKIENLFKVRGHNGTACVMRALCETGARSPHSEPQSFVAELLRVIFAMPETDDAHGEIGEIGEGGREVAPHFREAHARGRARRRRQASAGGLDEDECAARYALCERSLWSDLEFGMKL